DPSDLRAFDPSSTGGDARRAYSLRIDSLGRNGSSSRRSTRPWILVAIAAAACVLALLINGWFFWSRPLRVSQGPGAPTIAKPDQPRPAGELQKIADANPVAIMIKLDGAVWEPAGGPGPAERDVLAARRLRLRSGRATLAFLSGVTLTLEGPGDLELISIDRVFCREGRLRARVPKGAEGFVVGSPGSAVVDMGTEFAINVEADGRSRVMVFEGAAEAALLGTAGSPERTQLVERSKAFDLDPRRRRITESGAQTTGFVTATPLSVAPLVLGPAYAGAVLRSLPRGYWRFESISGGAIPNEVQGGAALRVNGPVKIAGGPQGNGHAVFKANEPDQFLYSNEIWETTRQPGHAIELWFAAEGISHASLVGLFPAVERRNNAGNRQYVHTFFVELTARDRQSLYRPASVRFLHRWPLDFTIGDNLMSQHLYIPQRWHHVVAQKNGNRMELYFDGEPDHSMTLDIDHPTVSCRLVVGRRTPDLAYSHDLRTFVGRLDELAVYNHPLSADEIRQHFRLANLEDLPP
ncbi:MAG TPA: LamG-like jellyroll fold domain-containing protein, partial [Isosphaeraceae bacterium]|nr:LamG-like jellyroll fold domain-containing protein [Isosphaeraceae bacterium]